MYNSVRELTADVAGDPEVMRLFDEEVHATRIISTLMLLRNLSNLTQRELAARMGCNPSKVSKMEDADDARLRWGDIAAYCKALGVEPQVLFDSPELPAHFRLRKYAEDIGGLTGKLSALLEEQGESELAAQIHRFTSEVLFKLLQSNSDEYDMEPKRQSKAAEPKQEYKTKRWSKGSTK